jgi:protein involved in polysaccharide export with SLBB domain
VLVIEVHAPEPQELDQAEIIVRPDGRGEIFFLPDHLLAGKTIAELRGELEEKLRAQVREAVVSIQVRPRGEQVYLSGQFVQPRVVDLLPAMTLGQAVSAVGGTRVTASSALLHRPYRDPENPEVYRIDLDAENAILVLLPGDQIVLERTWCATLVAYWQEYILGLIDIRFVFGQRVDI